MLSVKNTFIAVIKETTPYEMTLPTAADFILADADYSFEASYEEVERNAISGSLDALEALRGMQTGSASLTVELKGSGTRKTAPEADALFAAALDTALKPFTADAVALAGATTTSVQIAQVVGLTAGNIVKVDVDQTGTTPAFEYALITAITGTTTQTLTLSPALSAAPLEGADILGGVTYRPKSSGHDTVTVHLFLDCDGQDGLWYRFIGCRPKMSLANVSTGQIPKVKFDLDPVSWSVLHTGSNLATLGLVPAIDTTTEPPLCLGCVITLGSNRELIQTENMELDLGMEVGKRKSMIPTGGYRSSRYTGRAVNGKFDLDLDDDSQYTAWLARTASELVSVFGSTDGNIAVNIVPLLKRSGVAPKDTDGVWTQDVTWKAGRTTTIEPIYFAFF